MWSYRIVAPYQFERTSIAEKTPECLGDRQVLLRFLAAGVCGSDMPAFRGVRGPLPGDDGRSGPEKDGYPIHEVVGEVVASRHREHRPGDHVVGWASAFDGLTEGCIGRRQQHGQYHRLGRVQRGEDHRRHESADSDRQRQSDRQQP